MVEIYKLIEKAILKLSRIACFVKNIDSKWFYPIVLLIICFAVSGFKGEKILADIAILNSDLYSTIVYFVPGVEDFISSTVGKVLLIMSVIFMAFMLILRWFYKKPALLIKHTTMGHDLSTVDEAFYKEYAAKSVDMTKVKVPKNADDKSISCALRDIESVYDRYKNTGFSNVFYYGVSHIPFVFRLGYLFGQSKEIKFLHRFRKSENEQGFRELPEREEKSQGITFDKCNTINVQGNHDELIVAISTTYPIKDDDIKNLDPNCKCLQYKFEADSKSMHFDFFSSQQKINGYADDLVKEIRELVKKYNISTIHMLISSSVPFTFYFAQQLNTQQFPRIIVYQYENQKYSWGIDVTESDPSKAIIRLDG